MKLERIGEWVKCQRSAVKQLELNIWFKPTQIMIRGGHRYWFVDCENDDGKRMAEFKFKTESEALEFAREIMGGKEDGLE